MYVMCLCDIVGIERKHGTFVKNKKSKRLKTQNREDKIMKPLPEKLYVVRKAEDEGTEDEYSYLETYKDLVECLEAQPEDVEFVGFYELKSVNRCELFVEKKVEVRQV